ncbi:MAG: type IV secretion system DNA-binding domain-containing protein [bacterium]|nr:type IV secretion system DNA-binding domain-containing protein [bacterium]
MADSPKDQVIYFAETDSRNNRKKFGIKTEDRSKHVYVIGKTGMGKSTLLENMAIQDIQNGNGIAFIDPHGGTAEKLLDFVPKERIKDVLYFAPFDTEYPVAFNVMEDVGANKRHLVVSGLMSAFMKLFGEESFSDRMQYILQNTILALLEYPGSTMLGINKMLVDKEYRKNVIANITDPSVKAYWTQEYAGYTERFAAEAIPAIQNKIGQFTSNPLIRNIIGQEKSSFNLRKIMDEKKIVIVNLSKGRVGEDNARLLGSMLITKIYLAAMSRADERASSLAKLPPFFLYVDEFQSFADKSFADILSEARKYKLNLTMAHMYIEQMEEEVRDAVFGNVGTMIVFRVGAYDADVLEKEFAPVFIAEDLVNLGLRQIYLKLMIDSVASPPFSATTMPPMQSSEVSHTEEIIEYSRKTFAQPRSEVEKRITDWHEAGRVAVKTAPPRVFSAPPIVKPQEKRPIEKVILPVMPAHAGQVGSKIEPKPLPSISLETLKKSTDNQRKPDAKHVADLRDALRAMTGNQPKLETPPQPQVQPVHPQPTIKKEPSQEELKKILDVQ